MYLTHSPKIHRKLKSVALLTAFASLAFPQTQVTRTRDASFKWSVPSIWQNGVGVSQKLQIGPQWSKKDSVGFAFDLKTPKIDLGFCTIPAMDLGKTGATIGYMVGAGFGINANADYLGGAANVSADGNLNFTFNRDTNVGQECTVHVRYAPRSTASFSTTSPSLAASLQTFCGFQASLTGELDFLGKSLIGANTTLWDYTQPNAGFAGVHDFAEGNKQNLNDDDTVKALNALSPVGVAFSVPNEASTGHLMANSNKMSSDVFSPFFTINCTLAQFFLACVGQDKLSEFFDGSAYLDPTQTLTDLKASWDFTKVSGSVGLGLRHQFTFDPQPLINVTVTPTDPSDNIDGLASKTFSNVTPTTPIKFTMPTHGVFITGQFSATPTLTNVLTVAAQGGVDITPIDLSLKGTLGTGSFSKAINWEFNPYSYDWTSTAGSFFNVETDNLSTYIAESNLDPVAIGPSQQGYPTPEVFGDINSNVPNLTATPYAGYTAGADQPNPYRMFVYSEAAYGFSSDGQASSIVVTPESWDGQDLSTYRAPSGNVALSYADYASSRIMLGLDFDWSMLRPGSHTLRFATTGTFAGNKQFTSHFDIPVVVSLPPISINGDPMSDTTDGAHAVNCLDSTYTGQPLYVSTANAQLESEFVLDDGSIVLPTTRMLNGKAILTDDAHRPAFTDADEYQWINSGNTVLSFCVPPALLTKLAGSSHQLRLRTKDPFSDGYVLSDPLNAKPLYFPVSAPTLSGVYYNDLPGPLPDLTAPYSVVLKGTNFTPSTTVSAFGVGVFALPTQYVSPTRISVTLPQGLLDSAQLLPAPSIFLLSNNPYSISQDKPFGTNATIISGSGGTAVTTSSIVLPAPVITGVVPGSPIRGNAATLTVSGVNFTNGSTPFGATTVKFNGKAIDPSQVTFPSTGRGLTSMTVQLTADMLATAGPQPLVVQNAGGSSTFNVTVSNGIPVIATTAPSVRVGDPANPPVLELTGGPFFNDSVVTLKNSSATVQSLTMTDLKLAIDPSLNLQSTELVVLNAAPGGGQSATAKVTILEGDPSTLTLTQSNPVMSASGTYQKLVKITYIGYRTMKGTVALLFNLPAGVTLQGGTTYNGQPAILYPVGMSRNASTSVNVTLAVPSGVLPPITVTAKILP